MPPFQEIRNKKFFLQAVLLLSFLLAYFPVWKGLVSVWYNSDDYSHGFFILPIVVYSLWQKKEKLAKIPLQPSNIGLMLLIVSLVFYVLAFYAEIKTLASLAMIISVAGTVMYLYGIAIFREISFPLFFLVFMIPVPAQVYSALTLPLQLIVSQVSVWFSMLMGVPIFREGNVIYLPERTLEVVQACSGLRSLMSLLTLSVMIAYFTLHSNKLRILLMLSGIPAAIAVNVVRVLIMILAFHYFGYDLTQGSIHTIFGMVIFVFAIIIVFLVKGVLSFWDRPALEK